MASGRVGRDRVSLCKLTYAIVGTESHCSIGQREQTILHTHVSHTAVGGHEVAELSCFMVEKVDATVCANPNVSPLIFNY